MLVSITFGEFFPLEQLTRSWKASRTRQPRIFPRDGSLLGQALQMLGMARSWDRPFKMLGTGPLLGQALQMLGTGPLWGQALQNAWDRPALGTGP